MNNLPNVVGPVWEVPEYLFEIFAEDPAIALSMIELFLDDGAKHLRDLKERFLVNDVKAIAAITHTLKGSARQLGAQELANIAEAIENKIDQGNVTEALQYLTGLRAAWNSLQAEIRNRMIAILANDAA